MTLTNSTLTDNTADTGGGILNYDDGTMTLVNSTLAYNGQLRPAAASLTVALTLTNSTLTDNTANFFGGIRNFGYLTLTNSTLTRNTAAHSGGIYNFGGS